MFIVGQEVNTKYGVGKVVCVGSRKPYVYVRVHSRPDCIYIFNFAEVGEVEINTFAPPSPCQQVKVSGEFGHHQR